MWRDDGVVEGPRYWEVRTDRLHRSNGSGRNGRGTRHDGPYQKKEESQKLPLRLDRIVPVESRPREDCERDRSEREIVGDETMEEYHSRRGRSYPREGTVLVGTK